MGTIKKDARGNPIGTTEFERMLADFRKWMSEPGATLYYVRRTDTLYSFIRFWSALNHPNPEYSAESFYHILHPHVTLGTLFGYRYAVKDGRDCLRIPYGRLDNLIEAINYELGYTGTQEIKLREL